MRDELQQLIRAGAAHDSLWLQPKTARNGIAQQRGCSIRIEFERSGGSLVGFDGLPARTYGRFVRGKLVHLGTFGRALPWHIGRDVEDAGLWLGAGCCHGVTLMGRG